MKNIRSFGSSYLFFPLIPLVSILILPNSRSLYFDTKTTIPTNQFAKIFLLIIAISIGLNLYKILFRLSKVKLFENLNFHQYLPIFVFLILVFIPNILAEFNFELPAKLIYKFFRVSYLNPPFADLRTIIYGIKCDAVTQVGDLISCDSRNAPNVTWNYPSILLKLRHLGFLFENIALIVILIGIFLGVCIHMLSLKQTRKQNLFLTSFILSPPFLLCFGRLNFDLFILWIIWIGILALQSKQRILNYISWILFLISGLLKFYGFAAFVSIFHHFSLKKFIFRIVPLIIGLTLVLSDFSNLQNAVGKDIYGSVGFPVIAALLNGLPNASLDIYSYGSFFVLIYISVYVRFIIKKEFLQNKIHEDYLIILVFGFTFLFTWFTASNYYYRLLLLTPILLSLIKNKSSVFENYVITTTFFSFFISPKVFGPLQNLFLFPMVCYLIATLLLIFCNEIKETYGRIFKTA